MSQYINDEEPLFGEEDQLTVQNSSNDVNQVRNEPRRRHRDKKPATSPAQAARRVIRSVCAEIIGTFILTYITIVGAVVASTLVDDAMDSSRLLITSLIYGLSYGCIVYALSFDSSNGKPNIRQLNPAASLMLFIMRRMRLTDVIFFILSQYAGCWMGIALAPATLPTPLHKVGQAGLGLLLPLETFEGITLSHRFGATIMMSMFYLVIFAIVFFDRSSVAISREDDVSPAETRGQSIHEVNTLIVALLTTACSAILMPMTHDCMNPVLGMAFIHISNAWHTNWLSLFGPYLGAICAGILGLLSDIQLDKIEEHYGSDNATTQNRPTHGVRRRRRQDNSINVQMSAVYHGDDDLDL